MVSPRSDDYELYIPCFVVVVADSDMKGSTQFFSFHLFLVCVKRFTQYTWACSYFCRILQVDLLVRTTSEVIVDLMVRMIGETS